MIKVHLFDGDKQDSVFTYHPESRLWTVIIDNRKFEYSEFPIFLVNSLIVEKYGTVDKDIGHVKLRSRKI